MIQLILNAKFYPSMCKTTFEYRCTCVGGAKVLIYLKMSRYQSFCVIHKYLDKSQNLLFHDLMEWDGVPIGYSLNTHMFIFGWHPLVKYVSLWVIRHFIPFEVYFKTSSEHSDWNSRCVLNNFIISTSNDFQLFCQCSSMVLDYIKKNKHFYGT